jgi:hypothetical protein
MNAYSVLVPDKNRSLTKAGCVILSSLVPHFIHGETSLGTTLENIVSQVSIFIQAVTFKLNLTSFFQITKRKLLASRLWAFPLSGGSPLQWVLGWVDWSTHKMGLFKGVGRAPDWAKKVSRFCFINVDI